MTDQECTKVNLLEQSIKNLKERVNRDESAYTGRESELEERVELLEKYIIRLESRLTLGKGIFLGLSFTIGGAVFTVWDKLRTTVLTWVVE